MFAAMASQRLTSGQALRMKLTIDGPRPLVEIRFSVYRKHLRKAQYYLQEVYSYRPSHSGDGGLGRKRAWLLITASVRRWHSRQWHRAFRDGLLVKMTRTASR